MFANRVAGRHHEAVGGEAMSCLAKERVSKISRAAAIHCEQTVRAAVGWRWKHRMKRKVLLAHSSRFARAVAAVAVVAALALRLAQECDCEVVVVAAVVAVVAVVVVVVQAT